MKTKDLRELTIEKLEDRLEKLESELSDAIFDIKMGQEKDYSVKGKKQKEIARIKTLLSENNLGITVKVEENKTKKETKSKKEDKSEK